MRLTTCPLVITVGVDEVAEEDKVEVIHQTIRLKKAEYNVNFVVARTTLLKIVDIGLIIRSSHPPLLDLKQWLLRIQLLQLTQYSTWILV